MSHGLPDTRHADIGTVREEQLRHLEIPVHGGHTERRQKTAAKQLRRVYPQGHVAVHPKVMLAPATLMARADNFQVLRWEGRGQNVVSMPTFRACHMMLQCADAETHGTYNAFAVTQPSGGTCCRDNHKE